MPLPPAPTKPASRLAPEALATAARKTPSRTRRAAPSSDEATLSATPAARSLPEVVLPTPQRSATAAPAPVRAAATRKATPAPTLAHTAPVAARAPRQTPPSSVSPGMWENLLRPPLDRLMREGAALGHCSLPPAVRQYAENMINAAGDLAKILDNPGEMQEQSGVGEQRAPFNLQHLVREAHDAVTSAAENAGIGLAWYMPPLLGHMYEGQARALAFSGVRNGHWIGSPSETKTAALVRAVLLAC